MEHSDYVIISAPDPKSLETKVNEMIKKNFEPAGGIAIHANGSFHQAMIYKLNL